VSQLLTDVGLSPEVGERFPHEFSGVSALDVSIKAQVVNLMLDLQAKLGVAFLFISHDMAVVERISHRVAVMYTGEIVEIGDRASIFGDPQHPYTKTLLSAVPVADPDRKAKVARSAYKELKSPIRPMDFQAPARRYREVSPTHQVLESGPE
jgi:peptide/nickel transport system ATP-binding protein